MAVTTHVLARASGAKATASGPSARAAVAWLLGGAAVTFAASFVASDLLGLHHDLYLLVYATFAMGYLAWFLARSGVVWREVLRKNLWWSLAVGVAVGLVVVRQLLDQAGTAHPRGTYFDFELVWRGLIYGVIDALVLAVFPALLAYVVLGANRKGLRRKTAFAALVLLFSVVMTASYHLGYATYRGSDVAKPLVGAVMWDVPAVLTGNPAGALIAHAAVHTSAVVHQYYGGKNHYLPPELSSDYPERAGGTAGQLIASGWLLAVGVALVLTRHRWSATLRAPRESAEGKVT
jgi:hypothetical protein